VFQDRPGRLRELVTAGALCSITAGALEGNFGQASQWFALELLRDGLVHSVASDAHAAVGRPPGLQSGLDAAARHLPGVVRQARWLTNDAPAAILAGDPLPDRPRL
jgi:protein-tyrosine phosphatase